MESVAMENSYIEVEEKQDAKASQSAENFQKFMYELFEKNGVMNDLRSYLRGHIINVLKNAQTGDLPSCQKHFTQRLEPTYQAMNILIAEYLLRLEFSYTMSVFVSEIPLANMVFSFAKILMKKMDNDDSKPRFKDSDVWSILNYLGVRCDSEHATRVAEMYRVERNYPLLLCILKSAPLFKEPIIEEPFSANSSQDSQSIKSLDLDDKLRNQQRDPSLQEKCRHCTYCKSCHAKIIGLKEKYRRKKKHMAKNIIESSTSNVNVESLMKNISLMERSLIDEMFLEMKSVYEAEIDLIKEEEEKRVKRSLITHSSQLQKRREEMEESFKAREAELVRNVQQKKQFLWGLAKALREQHQHMSRAMRDVRAETDRLTAKEDSLKSQLVSAEEFLSSLGADMRQQISNELVVLETHLASMKRERDNITRERTELERDRDNNNKHTESEDVKSHYELLRNELNILKKYLETTKMEPKCLIERSTITDLNGVSSKIDVVLNNGQDVERRSDEDRVKPKQLVNDFKKQKNVNFSQSNLDEIFRERSQSRSRSSASSEAGDGQPHTEDEQRLNDENQQLRSLARQQREQIERLVSQQARLQAALAAPPPGPAPLAPTSQAYRPRTAPGPAPFHLDANRMSASASVNNLSFGWRKGAGEELSMFSNAQPRIVVPGDPIPFVGIVSRHTDNRRYLINQWRALRRRMSPLCAGGITKLRATSPIQRNLRERPGSAAPFIRIHLDTTDNEAASDQPTQSVPSQQEYQRPQTSCSVKARDINKSTPSQAREKLETNCKESLKDYTPNKSTNYLPKESPNGVLREAKLRLRKLEIEAEAVEQSYLDYRRKRDAFRDVRKQDAYRDGRKQDAYRDERIQSGVECCAEKDLKAEKPSTTTYKLDETYTKDSTSNQEKNGASFIDKYFQEYKTKFSEHFKNRNTAAFAIKPIPEVYTTHSKNSENYLETPLNEFRKYYQTERRFSKGANSPTGSKSAKPGSDSETFSVGTRKEIVRQAKHDKVKELALLKQNMEKLYNNSDQAIVVIPSSNELSKNNIQLESSNASEPIETVENKSEQNLLRIEVESGSKIDDVAVADSLSPHMLVIVESSVDKNRNADISESENREQTQISIVVSPKRSPFRTEKPRNDSATESFRSSRNGNIPSPNRSPKRHSSEKRQSPKVESPKRDIPDSGNSRQSDSNLDNMTTDDVVAIYHDDNEHVSSIRMEVDVSKHVLDNELEQNEDLDYPDDFSADVDNYNIISENGTHSPISLPKTSEDNFWDS